MSIVRCKRYFAVKDMTRFKVSCRKHRSKGSLSEAPGPEYAPAYFPWAISFKLSSAAPIVASRSSRESALLRNQLSKALGGR